jgi:hypothetical protein
MIGSLVAAFAPFGLAWLVGFALVRYLWPGRTAGLADRLIQVSLAFGLGVGATAWLSFVWLIVFGVASRWLAAAELALALGVLVGGRMRRTPEAATANDRHAAHAGSWGRLWIGICLCFALLALAFVGLSLLQTPEGGWDAVAIWNTHARVLNASIPGAWKAIFDPATKFSHPDYPFLLPAFIARAWRYAGQEIPLIPMATALGFSAALIGLLTGAVGKSRGPLFGASACAAIASCPLFLGTAIAQYADLPLAFFFLSALALLHRADTEPTPQPGLHVLAGMAAGMAALTKNEGALFVMALLAGRLGHPLLRRKMRQEWKMLARLGLGMLPMLAALILYKRLAPPNYLVAERHGGLLNSLLSGSRVKLIVDAYLGLLEGTSGLVDTFLPQGRHWHLLALALFALVFGIDQRRLRYRLSRWGLGLVVVGVLADVLVTGLFTHEFRWHWPVVTVGAIVIVAVGFDLKRLQQPFVIAPFATFVLINAGYFLVYMATPLDLAWQLTSSIDRLVLHTLPVAIFLVAMIASPWGSGSDAGSLELSHPS